MTVRDLIKASLRSLGVLAAGEEPSAEDAQDTLYALNDLIDSWQNERLMVYAILPQSFPLVPGKRQYTMGTGGDFNTERPPQIESVQVTPTAQGAGSPMNLNVDMIDIDQYQQLTVPGTQSTYPLKVYVDSSFPLRILSFYPVPSTVSTVKLYTWKVLEKFAALDDAVDLPPGYSRALRYSLAVEIADDFGVEVSQQLSTKARRAKAHVKLTNAPQPLLRCDPAACGAAGGFNWMTG